MLSRKSMARRLGAHCEGHAHGNRESIFVDANHLTRTTEAMEPPIGRAFPPAYVTAKTTAVA